MDAIDLFAGAGSFSAGATTAGPNVAWAKTLPCGNGGAFNRPLTDGGGPWCGH
jgi:hypothetical protein